MGAGREKHRERGRGGGKREGKKPGAADCGGIAERCYWRGSPLSSLSFAGFVFSLARAEMNY